MVATASVILLSMGSGLAALYECHFPKGSSVVDQGVQGTGRTDQRGYGGDLVTVADEIRQQRGTGGAYQPGSFIGIGQANALNFKIALFLNTLRVGVYRE